MTTTTDDLVDLEERFWRAVRDHDVERAARMTNDPCIVTGAQGVARINSRAFASMLTNASWELHDFAISDVQVQELDKDLAIVAYKFRESLTVDGAPLTIEAAETSTWMRREGEWRCVLHTESLIGDPFGRARYPGNFGPTAHPSSERTARRTSRFGRMSNSPAFADVTRGNLRLLLSGPTGT